MPQEYFFFDPMRLDWEDTSLEASVRPPPGYGCQCTSAQQWCVKLQVPAMAFQAVMGSSIDSRKKITENVLLAGANTLFDGLPQMLFKQLKVEGKARVRPLPPPLDHAANVPPAKLAGATALSEPATSARPWGLGMG
jgi:hypothetical protein